MPGIDEVQLEHRLTRLEEAMQNLCREFKKETEATREDFRAQIAELREEFGLAMDTLGKDFDKLAKNEQQHMKWLMVLLTGSFLMTAITWLLKLLGWA